MHEMPPNLDPEELKRIAEEKEQQERYEDYMKKNPPAEIAPLSKQESLSDIQKFEMLVASFEAEFSIEELNEIIDLSPELENALRYANETDERIAAEMKTSTIPGYAEIYKAKMETIRNTVLSPEDEQKCNLIVAARKALIPIDEIKKKYEERSPEIYEKIKADYKRLTNAVGFVHAGKIDHTR